ncbi:MAG: glycerate kinase [Schwartzia sp.]|nr:glycerate kinase [Schwartzia sp. (in: firmicutes)]
MKKIVIAPDSFTGTLSSGEVAKIISDAVRECSAETEIVSVPIADGGEGTVDAFLTAVGGERVEKQVTGPKNTPIPSFYGRLPDGTAVVEMAAAAGLPLMGGQLNVGMATTYGVGELMRDALEHGARRIILGLGGSATNDGGCGAAAALGVRFLDAQGAEFVPTGATLSRIASIDSSNVKPLLRDASIIAMCDIDNPLCGERGAAAVFGPQKGADAGMVRTLDEGLLHLAEIVHRDLGKDVAERAGAGAAGGFGAGAVAFFGAELRRGIDVVLETVRFADLLKSASLVLTGEGCFDEQSLMGKAVAGVASRAKRAGVPVVCIAGAVRGEAQGAREAGISAAFSIQKEPMPFAQAAPLSKGNLAFVTKQVLSLFLAAKSADGFNP